MINNIPNAPTATVLVRVPFNSYEYNRLHKIFGDRLSTEFCVSGPGYLPKISNNSFLLEKILKNLENKDRDEFCVYFNTKIERDNYQKLFDIMNNSRKINNNNFFEKNNILSSKHLKKYIQKNINYFVSHRESNNILKVLKFPDDRTFFRKQIIDKLN